MKKFFALVLALVMVLGLVACGEKAPAAEELKGVTEDTILVGNTAGTTGALATIGGPFNVGIEAAFAAYNAEGGFNGKSVKLQHYDDGGVATQSVTLTEQLIHEDEVFAIVGNFASNCVAANLPIIKEANVPMVYAAAGNNELLNEAAEGADRGIFPVQPLNFTEGRMLILRAFAPLANGGLGGTKVGVLTNTVEASQTILKGIEAEAADLPAAQKDAITYQNVTSTDFSAAINALKNAGCDVVIAAMGVVQRIMQFGASAMIGFGQGFQPFCGFNYGARLIDRVKKGFWFCVKGSFGFLCLVSVLGFIFAPQLVSIFRDDPQVIACGALALRLQCCSFPFQSFIVMSNMMQQVTGRTGPATFMAIARQGIFFIPAVLFLPMAFGVLGIQMAQAVSDLCTLLCAIPLQMYILRSVSQEN